MDYTSDSDIYYTQIYYTVPTMKYTTHPTMKYSIHILVLLSIVHTSKTFKMYS